MTVKYKNTKKDLIATSFIYIWTRKYKTIFFIFLFSAVISWPSLFVTIITFLYDVTNPHPKGYGASHLFFTFMVTTFLYLLYLPTVTLWLNSEKNNPALKETCSLRFDEEYLYSESFKSKCQVSWSLFIYAVLSKNYIILNKSAFQTYIIPRRAFDSDSEFQEFSRKVNKYFLASRT